MTTVACNRKMMAADQRVTWDDHVGYRSPKLHRINNSVFGLRGDNYANVFLDWARRSFSEKDRPAIPTDADFDVLELSPEGIFIWDEFLTRVEILDPNYAIGSGANLALYALRVLKVNPDAAVVEAAKIDPWTDSNVDKMELA